MPVSAAKDPRQALGRNPDRLTLEERAALAGKMVALEVYTPATFPLRRIEAIGASIVACIRMLQERGLVLRRFEYCLLVSAYRKTTAFLGEHYPRRRRPFGYAHKATGKSRSFDLNSRRGCCRG